MRGVHQLRSSANTGCLDVARSSRTVHQSVHLASPPLAFTRVRLPKRRHNVRDDHSVDPNNCANRAARHPRVRGHGGRAQGPRTHAIVSTRMWVYPDHSVAAAPAWPTPRLASTTARARRHLQRRQTRAPRKSRRARAPSRACTARASQRCRGSRGLRACGTTAHGSPRNTANHHPLHVPATHTFCHPDRGGLPSGVCIPAAAGCGGRSKATDGHVIMLFSHFSPVPRSASSGLYSTAGR